MELSYTIDRGKVKIEKVPDGDALAVIPEAIEGCPVTEIGAYAFSGTAVEEVHLPTGVTKIGPYAFYGCGKLKRLYCFGNAGDLGTGVFADDRAIRYLDLTADPGERSCLKDLLAEIRQTLRVRVHQGTSEARLIFPEYFEEAIENTPGRTIQVETHGCGQRYRNCFLRRELQYDEYDALFPHIEVQESEALVAELAVSRIRYPKGLTKRARERYEAYLREHWKAAAEVLIRADRPDPEHPTNLDSGCLPWYLEELLKPTEPQIAAIIDLAARLEDTETVSYLMDYRHRMFRTEDDTATKPRKRKFSI